jgi:hypothetical protein
MSKYKLLGEVRDIDLNNIPPEWYSETYTVSTSGGNGKVWEVKESKDCIRYTLSTDTVRKVQSKSHYRMNFSFKKHYVLTQAGCDAVLGLLVEESL